MSKTVSAKMRKLEKCCTRTEDNVHELDGEYLRDLRRLLDHHGYRCSLYGHFGQGCIHARIDFEEVLLWPDTFNNHFHPETAEAAVEVLETAGYSVTIPSIPLCCGRGLYNQGMRLTARRMWRRILTHLRPALSAGTPIIVLEPSCAAVFRDELGPLFPQDADARRLKEQTFQLAEFLNRRAPQFYPGLLRAPALLHGHCHQKALTGMDEEIPLLSRIGSEES
ncbi:MAG TPA: heterodisulfide reductase-related iron-sulfur binding cluster [Terriglobia bacterium]|nr:heterodisulfide reductase-related iron-sulfur binding cluster [Terriglobia bacterium]